MSVSLIDGHIDDDVMTDEQIIKALECCGDADCDNCPYSGDDLLRPCNDNLVKDTINLINRQKAEIKRLNGVIKNFKATKERQREKIEKLECHIESLEYELEDVKYGDG